MIALTPHRVEVTGVAAQPGVVWMKKIARNLTDPLDGFLKDTRYLILDRDTKLRPLREILDSTDTQAVLLPPRSPNLNADAERFVRSLKEECLDRMIFFGEHALRRALSEFEQHYHHERNHQGLGNRLIEPSEEVGQPDGAIGCRERLGGLLRYYHHRAA